ncbi:DUF1652 domain-containing protein [Pseudomonas fluorescens]|uniref:DUF1652 domain-containing protein n=1 Tax=Pseudomonas fluorescens TaxID=294 RepID=UPI002ACA721A|nr:DUF1652 domain-containing protein [Pseudomonas fluorescens]MDZ5431999.1 DUF1652 domain-containing protein [Pseudomonas fluorescens]
MISALELRHIIESGLLPRSCTCTVNSKGALLIKMSEPSSGHAELFVPGVLASALTSSRAISNLIGELKIEMAVRKKICVSAAVNAGLAASDPPSHIDSSLTDGVIRLQ